MANKRQERRVKKGVAAKRPGARQKTFVLDEGLRKMISAEAAQLKLSEEEYLRLLVHFSEVMRTSILPAGLLDGGLLRMLLGNPMAMGMLKNVIGNMVSRFGNGGGNSAPSNAAPGGMLPGMRPGAPQGNPLLPQRGVGLPGGGAPYFPQARTGQFGNPHGNPHGNMMYGMDGMGMNMNGGQRPVQGLPGMGLPQGGSQAPGTSQGGGLSNLFSMENLSQMFMQFFGNQGSTAT